MRFPLLLFAIALTVSVATGCGAATQQSTSGKFPIVVSHPSVQRTGIPSTAPSRLRGHRALLLSPTQVAFMTPGSVSCAWRPTRLTVLGPSAIRIDMRASGRVAACSHAVGFPIAVTIPRVLNVCSPVTVRLTYKVGPSGGGDIRRSSHTSVAPAIACQGASSP